MHTAEPDGHDRCEDLVDVLVDGSTQIADLSSHAGERVPCAVGATFITAQHVQQFCQVVEAFVEFHPPEIVRDGGHHCAELVQQELRVEHLDATQLLSPPVLAGVFSKYVHESFRGYGVPSLSDVAEQLTVGVTLRLYGGDLFGCNNLPELVVGAGADRRFPELISPGRTVDFLSLRDDVQVRGHLSRPEGLDSFSVSYRLLGLRVRGTHSQAGPGRPLVSVRVDVQSLHRGGQGSTQVVKIVEQLVIHVDVVFAGVVRVDAGAELLPGDIGLLDRLVHAFALEALLRRVVLTRNVPPGRQGGPDRGAGLDHRVAVERDVVRIHEDGPQVDDVAVTPAAEAAVLTLAVFLFLLALVVVVAFAFALRDGVCIGECLQIIDQGVVIWVRDLVEVTSAQPALNLAIDVHERHLIQSCRSSRHLDAEGRAEDALVGGREKAHGRCSVRFRARPVQ